MTTELKRFTAAYATMTVAAYEPVILRWISLIGIRFISNAVAFRLPKASAVKFDGKTPAALVLNKTLRKPIPPKIDFKFDGQDLRVPIDIHGRAISPDAVKKVDVPNYPNAVAVGRDVYLNGFSETDPTLLVEDQVGSFGEKGTPIARVMTQFASRVSSFTQGLKSIPMVISSRLGVQQPTFDFLDTRDVIQQNLIKAAQEWVKQPDAKDLMQLMLAGTNFKGVLLPHMWPGAISIHEALSPIGIAHYYRQSSTKRKVWARSRRHSPLRRSRRLKLFTRPFEDKFTRKFWNRGSKQSASRP